MRSCSKCGSYVPEGKILCPACWKPVTGAATTHRERTSHERRRTHARISDARKEIKREAAFLPRGERPYAGNTYEQHKSHDPRSRQYYKSKYEPAQRDIPEMSRRIIFAAAYFGFFFFLPLALLPNSKEAKFHANQGLVLFIANLFFNALVQIINITFGGFFEILAALPPLLMAYGAYNAFRGEMKELPVVGKIRLIKDDDNYYTNWGGRK